MAGAHPVAASAFGPAAEAYERGRPEWPAAALDAIAARLGLTAASSVLDLAAGTGKLTRALVERFGSVTAVEPVDGMRAVLAREVPAARAIDGAAEAIPLADRSVEAVFVAEAFHWFDAPRWAREMHEEFENQHLTTEQLLAQYASFSIIAGLPPEKRDAALAAFAAVLERHDVRDVDLTYRTEVATGRR